MVSIAGHSANKIHPLTSLRFFAAQLVVFYHTLYVVFPGFHGLGFVAATVRLGYVSVSFFFFLSGYILSVVYLHESNGIDRHKFWVSRFARIYPLFYITLVLDTPILLMQRVASYGLRMGLGKTAITFAANTVMLQAWVPIFRGIDNPNWSLSVETFFYLLFPFIGVILWRQKSSRLWLFALFLYFGSQALIWYATLYFSPQKISSLPLLHLCTFALGILLARSQAEKRARLNAKPMPSWRPYVVLAFGVVAFVGVVYNPHAIPEIYLSDGLLAPIFACVIWYFSSVDTWLTRLFSLPLLVLLGEASYGLYLIHIPVWHLFELLHLVAIQALYPLYLCLCIGLSILSFYFVETPARRWLLHRFAVRSQESMETASDAQ